MVANPRLRMFAGPNGSGKSTFKQVLPAAWLGYYLNADEIEEALGSEAGLDIRAFGLNPFSEELFGFLGRSELLARAGLMDSLRAVVFQNGRLRYPIGAKSSYFASVVADFLRQDLLEARASFSFETVMSHPDKVDILKKAQSLGYRTYLYYVATEDPEINRTRIAARVKAGGHTVPDEKIEPRYKRSLAVVAFSDSRFESGLHF